MATELIELSKAIDTEFETEFSKLLADNPEYDTPREGLRDAFKKIARYCYVKGMYKGSIATAEMLLHDHPDALQAFKQSIGKSL